MFFDRPSHGERAVLVHLRLSRGEESEAIHEFEELVRSAAMERVALVGGRRDAPHPRWFVGEGKLAEIKAAVTLHDAEIVVFDHELTPSQQRNVERELGVRALTRTELILLIFGQRARTHEGKLQVELAQLKHAQTRLVRGWTHLDRQKGGVNMRGAGETQIELDQRMLAERVRVIGRRLDTVRKRRVDARRKRHRAAVSTVALVGYTNAGKSTLFNRLADADVLAKNLLFATLDPTLRKLRIASRNDVVLADTVGFIRSLPVSLVAAFKATLEEVAEADLLLHVIDASASDADEQIDEVRSVLTDIGAGDRPVLDVMNKLDLIGGEPRIDRNADGVAERVWLSAANGRGVELLEAAITARLGGRVNEVRVLLAPEAGKTRSWLYRLGAVVAEEIREDGRLALTLNVDDRVEKRLVREPGVSLQG